MNTPKNIVSSVLTEQLKSSLIRRLSSEYASVGARLVHQIVNEAYALASATFAPLLLLPVLAEEKVQNAAAWSAHQNAILHGSRHDVAA
jgi:Na+(H+)/acetate symporter ActP